MAIEQPAYEVILSDGAYEIRRYAPMIVAVSTETDLRGDTGFSNVFNYIQGNNDKREKIAMTAPVINDLDQSSMTTAFVMPKAYTLDDLPSPRSPQMALEEKPPRLVATLRFSGSVNDRLIALNQAQLVKWITDQGYLAIGSSELARYNPPFIPGFLKRNEIWIDVQLLDPK